MAEANNTGSDNTPRTSRQRATEGARAARERASDAARKARERVTTATENARDKASQAAEKARESGRRAVTRGNELAVENPLLAIAGGVVIGALIAGLLPRTPQEDRAVGKVGRKVRDQAKKTAKSVRDNAKSELDELGLNVENIKKQVKGVTDKLGEAASGKSRDGRTQA